MKSDMEEPVNYMKDFPAPFSTKVKIKKKIWAITWALTICWLPKGGFNRWIRMIYRLFGADLSNTSCVHPTAHIYMPWNLKMGPWSTIASGVHVLNAAPFIMGQNCTVSERAFICCASHNIYSDAHEQINAPIVMGDRSWVAAEAFVGMGVSIGEGAVIGARAAVFKDVETRSVVGGNPAKFIKKRVINNEIKHE